MTLVLSASSVKDSGETSHRPLPSQFDIAFSVTFSLVPSSISTITLAPGTSSAADEVYGTTDEKANFQRLTRLLIRGGLSLLREVFDAIHPPANLPAVLGNPTIKSKLQTLRGRVLTQPEWDCLYNPSGPRMHGKSVDFDISLLCKLLRAICGLPPPITGWHKLPNSTDHSLGADLVRIRIYRNTIYGHYHSITDADFEKLWMQISEALLRIASRISSAKRDECNKAIEKFFHEPLTPDSKKCVDELRLWYLVDVDTKDMLEKIDEKVKQMKIKQEQRKHEQEQRHRKILIAIEGLKASGSVVSLPPREESVQSSFECLETRMSLPLELGIAGLSTSAELLASQQNNRGVLDLWYIVNSFKSLPHRLFEYLKRKIGLE